MKNWKESKNGFVFISHSSDDYNEVKIVRNYLEKEGFHALMFYLKCFEDIDKIDRAKELLAWEIEARDIFILCDSTSAKNSKWVEFETNHVKSLANKIITTIDIDVLKSNKTNNQELKKLDRLINKATIYSIFTFQDKDIVETILYKLNSRGFMLYKNEVEETSSSNQIIKSIKNAIQTTVQKGVVLAFISRNSKNSNWFWKEKGIALEKGAIIIPIIIDNTDIGEFPAFNDVESIKLIDYKNNKLDLIDRIVMEINRKVYI